MYLVEDTGPGGINLVFTYEDPRGAGYQGNVVEDVTLDFNYGNQVVASWPNGPLQSWPDGAPRPEKCVGQAPDNPKHYKVFKYHGEPQAAGYRPIQGAPAVFGSWTDYLRVYRPEDLSTPDWFRALDIDDEAARRRRKREPMDDQPEGTSRDDVANWVARTHFIVDPGVYEIWYLPREAPSDEIRLLEVNDRLAGSETKADAIDFGLDVEGAQFRLFVADVSTDLLDLIKNDPSCLPSGWSLDDKRVWRRGA